MAFITTPQPKRYTPWRDAKGRKVATHRLSETPEYKTWANMIFRCTNPNSAQYHRYGQRGIGVCSRWINSFELFLADMGPKPGPHFSIERTNNDCGYSPENCIWATAKDQAANRKSAILHKINGQIKTLKDWAEHFEINYSMVQKRVQRGWPIDRALAEPSKRGAACLP